MQVEKYSKTAPKLDKKWASQDKQSRKTIFLLKVIILYYARSFESTKPAVNAKYILIRTLSDALKT